jgi:uncharacterized membrane protein
MVQAQGGRGMNLVATTVSLYLLIGVVFAVVMWFLTREIEKFMDGEGEYEPAERHEIEGIVQKWNKDAERYGITVTLVYVMAVLFWMPVMVMYLREKVQEWRK